MSEPAFKITQKGPGDFEPVYDGHEDAVEAFCEEEAHNMAVAFVCAAMRVPGLALDRDTILTCESAWIDPDKVEVPLGVRGSRTDKDGRVLVDNGELMIPLTKRLIAGEDVADIVALIKHVAVEYVEQKIWDNAEEVYAAEMKRMERDYE